MAAQSSASTGDVLLVDRTEARSGAHPGLSSVEAVPLRSSDHVALRILIEPTSIEVFADGGCTVVTDLIDTALDANGLTIEMKKGGGSTAAATPRR